MVRVILFNGKGGVGKSTNSAATALWFASQNFKTLLISTDPAPSLGDSLGITIGNELIDVEGIPNLFALEIDGHHEWKKLYEYIKNNNASNAETFFSESGMPGMDELAALFRVFMFVYDIRYDVIVVDTAPTGHTMQMLNLPKTIDELSVGLKKFLDNMNFIKSFLTGGAGKKTNDRIDSIRGCLGKLKLLFSNTNMTSFNLVSTPEFMSLREEMRAFNKLSAEGINVQNIILNKIHPPNDNCQFCKRRNEHQQNFVNIIEKEFNPKGVNVIRIMARPEEVIGKEMLTEIGKRIIEQMAQRIIVNPACQTLPMMNGEPGAIVKTEIPYVPAKFLRTHIKGNKVIFKINYGLHEDVVNVLEFGRNIKSAQAFNDNGTLNFKMI